MNDLQLPARCLARVDGAIADMDREDTKAMRFRDSRVYVGAYAIIETFGLMLRLDDPSDPAAVRLAVAAITVADEY